MSSAFATSRVPAYSAVRRQLRLGGTWAFLVITALVLALFGSVLADMVVDWWTVPELSQGMLIPPLALYVAWLNRNEITSLAPETSGLGILISALGCAVFLVGRLASEFFLTRMAFVIILTGLCCTFWGKPRTKRLAFPFLLLATMVPLPGLVYNSLAAPLQLLASDLATRIAQALGTSVYRDGNVIQLAGMSLGVAEACSGLNSLSALLVGSLIVGYLFCNSWISRTLLCLVSIPLAIGMNILRVAGTAVLADYNQNFALGFYHSFSGWLVFVAGLGLLYVAARLVHTLFDRAETA
jgi:exosortase